MHELAWAVEAGSWVVGEIGLAEVRSALYRRPEAPAIKGLGRGEAKLARGQWRAVIAGLETITGIHWVSQPSNIDRAENKLLQLQAAASSGHLVPETLVTNGGSQARAFLRAHRGVAVCKALDAPLFIEERKSMFVFTSLVSDDDAGRIQDIELAPMVLQQRVWPKVDVRVVVIGTHAFGAACKTSQLDWRTDPTAQWAPCDLPSSISSKCVELVRSLGLVYSGIDLALDERGRHWFLELNPNGEWGWLQARGVPVAQALADELVGS